MAKVGKAIKNGDVMCMCNIRQFPAPKALRLMTKISSMLKVPSKLPLPPARVRPLSYGTAATLSFLS